MGAPAFHVGKSDDYQLSNSTRGLGGVGGFIDFREIIQNPKHLAYAGAKKWARYWSP